MSRASCADLATAAIEICSKALATGGSGPFGRASSSVWRTSISLQPPQPGSTPTPASTRPA